MVKIRIEPAASQEELDEIEAAAEAGLLPERDAKEATLDFLQAKEIVLTENVVKFAQEELGMTAEEFVAMLLKEAGATQ